MTRRFPPAALKAGLSTALVLAVLAAAGCDVRVGENGVSLDVAHDRAVDVWKRTYTVAPGGSLEIINVNGGITVEPSTGGAVEVAAERRARGGSDEAAKEALQKHRIIEEVKPDRVRIESEGPDARGGLFARQNISVEYRVLVPAGLNVSVTTQNGGIRLAGVNGTLRAATTNGGVRGENLSGSVSARTVNGGLTIDVAQATGPVELEVVNGGVRLSLPSDVKANLEADVVNGGVHVDDVFKLAADSRDERPGRTHVAGTLNGGGVRIHAQGVNGGVRIVPRADGRPQAGDETAREVVVQTRSR